MKRIVRQEIQTIAERQNSFSLTTGGSPRLPTGLKIAIQKHGVQAAWVMPRAEDGGCYPPRLVTEELATPIEIRPGDQIELAVGDRDEQGDVAGYAGLYRDGKLYATAVVRHASDRSLNATAPGDPAPIRIEDVEQCLDEALKKYNAERMEGTTMTQQEEDNRKIRTTFGGLAALTEEEIRQAEEYAEKYARALRRGDRGEADRLQSDEIHQQKQKTKKDAHKHGKFDFG